MLIVEVLGYSLGVYEDEEAKHLQFNLDDILLHAKARGISELNLNSLANELSMANNSIDIIPDRDFIERIRTILQGEEYAEIIDQIINDKIILKKPGELQGVEDGEAGDEAIQAQDDQSAKMQKTAMSNIKSGDK